MKGIEKSKLKKGNKHTINILPIAIVNKDTHHTAYRKRDKNATTTTTISTTTTSIYNRERVLTTTLSIQATKYEWLCVDMKKKPIHTLQFAMNGREKKILKQQRHSLSSNKNKTTTITKKRHNQTRISSLAECLWRICTTNALPTRKQKKIIRKTYDQDEKRFWNAIDEIAFLLLLFRFPKTSTLFSKKKQHEQRKYI